MLSAAPQASLTLPLCSPNYPSASWIKMDARYTLSIPWCARAFLHHKSLYETYNWSPGHHLPWRSRNSRVYAKKNRRLTFKFLWVNNISDTFATNALLVRVLKRFSACRSVLIINLVKKPGKVKFPSNYTCHDTRAPRALLAARLVTKLKVVFSLSFR